MSWKTIGEDVTSILLDHGLPKEIILIIRDYHRRGLLNNGHDNLTGIDTVIYNDGEYMGEFLDGNRHGKGQLTTPLHVFNGTFVDNQMIGIGQKTSKENGGVRTGYFVDGYLEGYGHINYGDNEYFYGNFVNDDRDGFGCYTWADGSTYNGYYKDDMKNGKGVEIHADGSIKEGDFKNGKLNGYCTTQNADKSIIYRGEYVNGVKHGKGVLTQYGTTVEVIHNNGILSMGTSYSQINTGDVVKREIHYINNKIQGDYITHFPDGGKCSEIYRDSIPTDSTLVRESPQSLSFVEAHNPKKRKAIVEEEPIVKKSK